MIHGGPQGGSTDMSSMRHGTAYQHNNQSSRQQGGPPTRSGHLSMHVIEQVSNAAKRYLLVIIGITKLLSMEDKDSKIAQDLCQRQLYGIDYLEFNPKNIICIMYGRSRIFGVHTALLVRRCEHHLHHRSLLTPLHYVLPSAWRPWLATSYGSRHGQAHLSPASTCTS